MILNTRVTNNIILMLFSVLIFNCNSKSFKNEQELLEYIKDEQNGYNLKKTIQGVTYSLVYRPTDLLVKQELIDSTNAKEIKRLRSKYNKYMYFNLSMSKQNQELLSVAPKNHKEFGAMVNQLAFGMQEKVHVYTASKDTLEMADYVYPRLYGMAKATTMMFVYPRDNKVQKTDYINFTIEDLGLYTGEVRFKMPTKKLLNEPQLKFY